MWGGGTLRAPDKAARVAQVFTQAPLLRDLARAAGTAPLPAPDSFAALRLVSPAASAMVWLDALQRVALRTQLAALDAAWAAPLERALDTRGVSLRLVIAGSGPALSFSPRASGTMQRLRRRWASPPNLEALLAAHADAGPSRAGSNA
jgi:hypothetical protein